MKMKRKVVAAVAVAFVAGSASAALMVDFQAGVNAGKTADAVGLGTGVAAGAGDVIVFTAASSGSYVKTWSVTSSDGGVVGAESGVWLDKNASVSYFSVTSGGTFNLGVAGNAATFDTFGAYVIGSDQVGGSVVQIGSAQKFVVAGGGVANLLDYGVLSSPGIVVEAAAAPSFTSMPAGYTSFVNSVNSRASLFGTFSAGAVSSQYIVDDTSGHRTAGVAFAEVIPEPATLGLIAFFGAASLFIRRHFTL